MSDFYQDAASRQGKQLQIQRRNAESALIEAETNGDTDTAARAIQEIADIEAAGARLNALHRQYTTPPAQQERESIFASHREPKTGDDALEILNYGKRPGDATYVTPEEYNRGLAELHRRKAMGDYHGKP
jgi:hypothetical protein